MKKFTPEQFAKYLISRDVVIKQFLRIGLEACAKKVLKDAKDKIGEYQEAVGPFPAWKQLSEYTMNDKLEKGYVFNEDYNPLLRTGELRDSYKQKTFMREAQIGSKDPVAKYHEFGTSRMPARPVLGPALYQNEKFIFKTIQQALITGLIKKSFKPKEEK
jgi:HK97 gp10 family phage protein